MTHLTLISEARRMGKIIWLVWARVRFLFVLDYTPRKGHMAYVAWGTCLSPGANREPYTLTIVWTRARKCILRDLLSTPPNLRKGAVYLFSWSTRITYPVGSKLTLRQNLSAKIDYRAIRSAIPSPDFNYILQLRNISAVLGVFVKTAAASVAEESNLHSSVVREEYFWPLLVSNIFANWP